MASDHILDNLPLYPNDRVMVFMDGMNSYSAATQLGFRIDYVRLRECFSNQPSNLIRFYVYNLFDAESAHVPIRPLCDTLTHKGFAVSLKPRTDCYMDAGVIPKGNILIDITIDAMMQKDHFDVAIIASGDGNLCRLIQTLQTLGKRVFVLSTKATEPVIVSQTIIRQADRFIDWADIMEYVKLEYNQQDLSVGVARTLREETSE